CSSPLTTLARFPSKSPHLLWSCQCPMRTRHLPVGSRPDGDPETLRRAAHRLGDDLLDQLLPPAETTFVQPADRPLQGHLDAGLRAPGGVRHAAEPAGAPLQLEPGRDLDQCELGPLDVPEARHLLALHGSYAQVPQGTDGFDLIPKLLP